MRPTWLQLLVLTTAMVVSSLSLSALTDSWGFELPEESQTHRQTEIAKSAEPASEEAAEASEWGSWGLKTASGDFFSEEPDYVGSGWPQTQQPRRENGDGSYDTASDVRNGPNVYTYVTQNPWTFFDPLGLAQGAPRNKPATDQMFYPKLAYSIFVQPFVEAQQVGQMHLEQAAAEAGDGNVGMAASHTAAAVFEAVTTAVVEIGPAKFIKKAGKLNDVGKGVDATADLNRGVNGADNAIDAADALNDADRATDMTESAADIPPNQTGSYTNYHESGKTYDGKGTRARSQASGRRVERETGDSHTATEWDSADNTRDAFKDESLKLDSHGGAESADNYNKIESPGKKMREQDGET